MSYYQDQLSTISNYRVNSGETIRVNCPFCGGNKTMSITQIDGNLKWNCYKASCGSRGINNVGRNILEIRNALNGIKNVQKRKTSDIPEILSSPLLREDTYNYLLENNCLQAYLDGACRIEYSPKEHRVLFFNSDSSGCVGRSLKTRLKPKWKVYGETTNLFTVGHCDPVVLVEDAASACAVYATKKYTGVALLGTNLSYKQRTSLKQRDNITIALDKDASRKALQVAAQLRGGRKCAVRFLARDLKEYPPERLLRVIEDG
jgi:hypothetical protein